MLRKTQLSVAIAAALGITSLTALPAFAQQDDQLIEEVVVTGSRISRNPESYLGGMAIATGESIGQIGSFSTMDALTRVPSVSAESGRNNSNGGRGANFVEIHFLEKERALVLMDGRRVVPTIQDNLGLAVDLQSFPPIMIDRIEVLEDGASAVYGSDAIAGVVNVITKNDFEGFKIAGGYGEPEESGGESENFGAMFGVQGTRGRFVAGLNYVNTENLDVQERDWSKIPILGELDDGEGGKLTIMGSGLPPQGRPINSNIIFEPNQATGESFSDYDTFGLSGLNGCPSDGSLEAIICTNHRFNYNDIGGDGVSINNESKVYNFAGVGDVELGDSWSAYTNLVAQHREGTTNFTPLPVFGPAGRFTDLVQVPFDNPNIPADALARIMADELEANPDATAFQLFTRGLDLGNRKFEYDTDTMQATVGFKGDLEFLDRDWSADLWGTWGQSRLTEVTIGQLNVGNLQIAVDPETCALIDNCPKDDQGNPTYNPFGRHTSSQEEKEFINFDDHEKTETEMYHAAALISTSELFDLPAGGMGFAAGFEYREEEGSVTPSGIVGDGNSGGNFSQPTKGDYDLWEAYMEVDVPILADAPFARELAFEGAVRFSEYGDYNETTWKVGGRWSPIEMLSVRAQASTGFRGPNVLELFGGITDNFLGVTDACNADNQAANSVVAANCAAQGVSADFVQPASQLKISQGGNPELQPESSDNYSFGVVLTPEIWSNPRIAIDYYSVEVEDAIDTPNEQDVMDTCYETPGLAAPECDRIERATGADVTRFDLLLENQNKIETSGVDINATFSWDPTFGVITANWLVNYLDEWKQTTATGVEDDRTGKIYCDTCDPTAYPEWQSTLSTTLSQDNWSVNVTWRYIDEMDIDDPDDFNTDVDAVNYFDFYGSYNLDNIEIAVGVDNFTDEDPEFIPGSSLNTSQFYDFLGRFYFARLTYSL
jgi:iron complex outermembrane receptor protein